jgi:hypothetical protein
MIHLRSVVHGTYYPLNNRVSVSQTLNLTKLGADRRVINDFPELLDKHLI